MTMTIEQEIRAKAAELGFVACGFALYLYAISLYVFYATSGR